MSSIFILLEGGISQSLYVLRQLKMCTLCSQHNKGGVTRPCARARQAKRVLVQGRTGAYRGVQGRTGASRDKLLKMT